MKNKEAIEYMNTLQAKCVNGYEAEAINLAIKALEKDKCSSCKHYAKDYGETCLNPEGTCRVFAYDRYEVVEE